ncbi:MULTISPECIES: FMN-dependent NADH-azoreductase [Paenibacillus]|uniref:FMN dependent NADH:quinone oxidoreductase n=1 Tax=Paenibacillus odorifer TaxID=189426 RepID=A0ABX3GGA2_9BACL|nr:FMN-dependent NADH-azoreductase [Paenibacillus odorifer]OMC76241.1 FMN-dependent NADH-azoreductase [Paenibacillus odorifer]OMC99555.1 FMN-dependent NADH-azoreductase [Paenibacillus odorifer]OMD73462.1 FMN-dependent NADH-azoreductase [Paenibacillus odorifer]OMD84113.1 FMN-dependent NADH-azoreductase [Paenibacillus odorifer]
MTKVLFITANPNDENRSFSMAAGKAFIETYKETNPTDEIVTLDLFKEDIPNLDADVMSGWGKLRAGQQIDALSTEELAKVSRLNEILDQFIATDKMIFVTPMWNFSFPSVVKTYIDAVAVPGKTFRYTETGAVGLLHNKKVLHIQARGDFYSEGHLADEELGDRYLKHIMNFMGITEYEGLFIEGQAKMPNNAEKIKAAGIERAKQLAQSF